MPEQESPDDRILFLVALARDLFRVVAATWTVHTYDTRWTDQGWEQKLH